MINRLRLAVVTGSVLLAGTACTPGATSPTAAVTVDNCGRSVTLTRTVDRVVALGPSEVTTIWAAGGAGKLVGRDDAGLKSKPYPRRLTEAVAAVPQLGSGGEISRETLVGLSPDLVVGSVSETITPDTLGAVDIPMVALRGNCGSDHAPGTSDGTADFDDVFSDVAELGRLMGTQPQADAAVADLRSRVEAARTAAEVRGRSAAAVIVFDNSLEVYGRRSMAHTQFDRLGLRDAFGDTDARVFEANIEQLTDRDPDVIMILSYGESDAQARATFLDIPGAAGLRAVRSGHVVVQPYEYSSQGMLSVTGLENLARALSHG